MIRLMKKTFYKEEETKRKLCEFIAGADRLSMGPECKKFEESFSAFQGCKYSVLFNSGSSANLALIQALTNLNLLKKGDSIGFSSLTWSTNVMPLLQTSLRPIPIDISIDNLNINSDRILEAIERYNLKAVFITNLLGLSGNLPRIREICKEKNVLLLEDNCESLGSIIGGEKLGNFGLGSTCSFFVGHHLSTIEGGMVCTNNEDLHDMLLMVRAHGWGRNLDDEKLRRLNELHGMDDFYGAYTFYSLGYNLRPTEITGFLGSEQLKYAQEIFNKRNHNFKIFREAARQNPHLIQFNLSHMDFVSNFAYPLVFKTKEAFEKAKAKFSKFVEIRPIVGGNMTIQPFFEGREFSCKNAEVAHLRGFYVPNNPDLTEEEVRLLESLIKNGLEDDTSDRTLD